MEISAVIESEVRARGAALMGVVNTTPDSFFDGGRYMDADAGRARVDELLLAGAAILDIGGESSRPGALRVAAAEQIERIRAAVEYAVHKGALVSVDTTDPEVADYACRAGAKIVNDVSCLANEDLASVAARHDAVLLIMHSRGSMTQMRGFSQWPDKDYGDIVKDVAAEWGAARDRAVRRGVPVDRVWFDPGLGFSKNARHSLELLGRLSEFRDLAPCIVVGPGRKSFIASVDAAPPADRLGGTVAACLAAADRGAHVLRIHDVREVSQALLVRRAVGKADPKEAHGAL